ncbi:MAG: FtsX-like permease family protein [Candidatus Bathyarchaeota archaeon]|nr:FtsX-like permease family protein [Candidatus Bathyarchaeota archaeon]
MFDRVRIALLVSIAIVILVSTSTVNPICLQQGGTDIRVKGRILDYKGSPIANSIVIALDFSSFRRYYTYSDEYGCYELTLPAENPLGAPPEYILYAIHVDLETGLPDYTIGIYPSNPYDHRSRIKRNLEIDFKLYPAAIVRVEGSPWYIEFLEEPLYYVVELVDPSTLTAISLDNTIVIYGRPPYAYSDKPDVRFLLGYTIDPSIVVVPAGMNILLRVEAGFRREMMFKTIEYTYRFMGEYPFNLTPGSIVSINLDEVFTRFNLDYLKSEAVRVHSKLVEAMDDGFFVGGELHDLNKALEIVREAEEKLKAIANYDELRNLRFTLVEPAYYIVRSVEGRISYMYITAEAQYIFFPWVLSLFSLIFAFFLFDEDKPKIVWSIIVYVILILFFLAVYPTAYKILSKNAILEILDLLRLELSNIWLLTLSSTISFIVLSLIFLYAPRKQFGVEVTGRASVREIFAAIASIAKRNVKRRKIRGFFSIVTVAILVFSFTTLTSIAWVYGLATVDTKPPARSVEGILIRKTPVNLESPTLATHLMTKAEVEGVIDILGGGGVSVKVQNTPSSTPILVLKTEYSEAEIYGVIGLDLDDRATDIGSYIARRVTGLESNDTIAISDSLARRLGVSVGGFVDLYLVKAAEAVYTGRYRVEAIVRDEYFRGSDIDGSRIAPLRLKGGELKPVEPEEALILPYMMALEIDPERIQVARIYLDTSVDDHRTQDAIRVLAMKGYVVFQFHAGKARATYIDMVLEVRGIIEFLVPFTLVLLNTLSVFVQIAYERERELKILATLGLTPGHIAALFILESMVIGAVGGGVGYLSGLGAYKLISLLGEQWQIGVREKLEWYWSIIGLAVALSVTFLSAVKSAFEAAAKVTPSMVRRVKLKPEERIEREKAILKAYEEHSFIMPVKVRGNELIFFEGYILDTLKSMKFLFMESVSDIKVYREEPRSEDQPIPKETIEFRYRFTERTETYEVVCRLNLLYRKDSKDYSVILSCKPTHPGMPYYALEYAARNARRIVLEWIKVRDRIVGSI